MLFARRRLMEVMWVDLHGRVVLKYGREGELMYVMKVLHAPDPLYTNRFGVLTVSWAKV